MALTGILWGRTMARDGSTFKWDDKVPANVRKAGARGLQDAMYAWLDDSNRLVPHETGALQGSGDVDVDESTMEGRISYNTPYAVRQHEDTTMQHPNGRQAKFVETPMRERGNDYIAHIADAIKGAIR